MRIPFVARPDVLDPIAVVGLGRVAGALARRLILLGDEPLHELRGAAGDDVLIVLGATEALPWVDGVNYLGRDPDAPRLLLPTMVRPAIAADAFERAIARHAAALPSPWAVLHDARLEHDPEKWVPVFGKRSCSSDQPERDDDAKNRHPALVFSVAHAGPIDRDVLGRWSEAYP